MSNKNIKTFIVKGTVVTNPYLDNISRAQFVRIVATSSPATIQINSVDSTVLGEVYLHIAGHEITIEKAPDDSITTTTGTAKVHAIGSPRN
jgi:hypothetical protein